VTRIAVLGASGNGKTTVGRTVAERLGVPFAELDAFVHGPGWKQATDEELRAKLEAFLASARDGWVVDGNYGSKLGDLVVERADTAVWLDQPLPLLLRRLARRTAGRIRRREELWNGNRETIRNAVFARDNLFVWTIRSHRRMRREYPERFAQPHLGHVEFVRLRSPDEVNEWLGSLGPRQGALPS
jgi:adenylate kinase family enzyme